jgi:hypothetical protein
MRPVRIHSSSAATISSSPLKLMGFTR